MDEAVFRQLVDQYYKPLYCFAFSLAGNEAEAADLTQETFYRCAQKGDQLRDTSKYKSWLFTVLHREFLGARRRIVRFPHVETESVEPELPVVTPTHAESIDSARMMECLLSLDESYRAPLLLFYLEDHSYREIAEILDLAPGTVMSRLARGKEMLRRRLVEGQTAESKVVPIILKQKSL